ncbi:hypothetical protein ACRAWF_07390 [Streptomyces sp. L7]
MDLVLTLFALDTAAIGLDELEDRADSEAVRAALLARHAPVRVCRRSDRSRPQTLLDLAFRVAHMRAMVEETHELYSIIDGRAWFRTEGICSRAGKSIDRYSRLRPRKRSPPCPASATAPPRTSVWPPRRAEPSPRALKAHPCSARSWRRLSRIPCCVRIM